MKDILRSETSSLLRLMSRAVWEACEGLRVTAVAVSPALGCGHPVSVILVFAGCEAIHAEHAGVVLAAVPVMAPFSPQIR